MKIYHYITLFFSLILLDSCSKDEGNYDYKDINEVSITGINATYTLLRNIDTLRIKPTIIASMDEGDTSRYRYMWILRNNNNFLDTISESRSLVYPIVLEPIEHDLYFRIQDKQTGVEFRRNAKLMISTPYSRGILLTGEDEQGYAETEMLSMLNDTLHLKNILSQSGLPRLKQPIGFLHTGGNNTAYNKLWAFTGEGSYYLDRITMKGKIADNANRLLFISEAIPQETMFPVAIAPQIITSVGAVSSTLYRAMITKGGDVFTTFLLINGGDFYNNPINRIVAQGERFPAAPYPLYSIGNMTSLMWYDTKNQRFLNYTGFGLSSPSVVIADVAGSLFPWNQPAGRTLVYAENTRNTDGGSTNGNSFAIMKDANNTHHVYKFYASGASPAKRAFYTIKPIATDFDKADFYAFSSNRTVIFYSVRNKLYAYDYNPGNEKLSTYPEIGNDEITMVKFDTQINHLTNSLYVATYNSGTKGKLRRFNVGANPNFVELTPVADGLWENLIKIKNMSWRAVN